MQGDKISLELADCLERLRHLLSGIRGGGVEAWTPASRQRESTPSLSPLPCSTDRTGAGEVIVPGGTPPEAVRARDIPPLVPAAGNGASFEDRDSEANIRENTSESLDRSLADIVRSLSGCTGCRLHSGRKNLVFGEGSLTSGIVFVGEGPGFEEDQQGRPFVGKAGKLLDRMIGALGFDRSAVYICNVVKCRPPENRTPLPDEIAACSPFLFKQIQCLKPKVLCALGACAAQTLLGASVPISRARLKVHRWRDIPLICTYHPAYLLRNSAQKAAVWQDLKELLRVLGRRDS